MRVYVLLNEGETEESAFNSRKNCRAKITLEQVEGGTWRRNSSGTHKRRDRKTRTQTLAKVRQPTSPPNTQTDRQQNALFPIQIKVSVNINVEAKSVRHNVQAHKQHLRSQTQIQNFKSCLVYCTESCPRITMECVCFCVCIVLRSDPVSCLVLSVTWRLFPSAAAIVVGCIKEDKRSVCVHLHICTYVQTGVCMFWTVD